MALEAWRFQPSPGPNLRNGHCKSVAVSAGFADCEKNEEEPYRCAVSGLSSISPSASTQSRGSDQRSTRKLRVELASVGWATALSANTPPKSKA